MNMYHLERKHNLCKECKVMTSIKYKDNAAYFCNSLAHIAITQTTNASNIMRLNDKEAHSNNINKTKTKKNYSMSKRKMLQLLYMWRDRIKTIHVCSYFDFLDSCSLSPVP
jgi:acetyl-CoA carboxylase beta subunit